MGINEWSGFLLSLLAGGLIGLFYFGGLWLTIRYVTAGKGSTWLLLASFVGRMAVAVGALVWLVNGRLPHLITALLGFFLIRTVLIRRLGLSEDVKRET
ncbi:MAG: ATP synthase subunit I [Chloroflexota bacterium]